MDSFTVEFLGRRDDLIRQIKNPNQTLRCLIVSRKHIASVLKSDGVAGLDVSGIYILVGPSRIIESEGPKQLISQLYVGKATNVSRRIDSHDSTKKFWNTAIVFYRDPVHLNEADLAYLEYRLITLASEVNLELLDVDNIQTPSPPRRDPILAYEMDQLIEQMRNMLEAMGHDYFSRQVAAVSVPPQTEEESNVPDDTPRDQQLVVPAHLASLVERIEETCKPFGQVEFYRTRGDIRAKILDGDRFRVFLTISLRRRGLRLHILRVANLTVDESFVMNDEVRAQLRQAYDLMHRKLFAG